MCVYPAPPKAHICSRDSMHGESKSCDVKPSRHRPTSAWATTSSSGGMSHGSSVGRAPATHQPIPSPVKAHRIPL
eukprot:scaffold67377_cov28-Tisochrysis_lutea.AAC.4